MSARTFPPVDLQVVISSWEIECCAPPPVVGELTSWTLIFQPVFTQEPPRLVTDGAFAPGRRAGARRRRDVPTGQVYRAETGILLTLPDTGG